MCYIVVLCFLKCISNARTQSRFLPAFLFCKCPLQLHPYFAIPLCECSVLLQYVVWMQLHIAFPCNCTLQFTSTTAFYNPIVQLRPAIAFSNPHLRLPIAVHISNNLFVSIRIFNMILQRSIMLLHLCNCNSQPLRATPSANVFYKSTL